MILRDRNNSDRHDLGLACEKEKRVSQIIPLLGHVDAVVWQAHKFYPQAYFNLLVVYDNLAH